MPGDNYDPENYNPEDFDPEDESLMTPEVRALMDIGNQVDPVPPPPTVAVAEKKKGGKKKRSTEVAEGVHVKVTAEGEQARNIISGKPVEGLGTEASNAPASQLSMIPQWVQEKIGKNDTTGLLVKVYSEPGHQYRKTYPLAGVDLARVEDWLIKRHSHHGKQFTLDIIKDDPKDPPPRILFTQAGISIGSDDDDDGDGDDDAENVRDVRIPQFPQYPRPMAAPFMHGIQSPFGGRTRSDTEDLERKIEALQENLGKGSTEVKMKELDVNAKREELALSERVKREEREAEAARRREEREDAEKRERALLQAKLDAEKAKADADRAMRAEERAARQEQWDLEQKARREEWERERKDRIEREERERKDREEREARERKEADERWRREHEERRASQSSTMDMIMKLAGVAMPVVTTVMSQREETQRKIEEVRLAAEREKAAQWEKLISTGSLALPAVLELLVQRGDPFVQVERLQALMAGMKEDPPSTLAQIKEFLENVVARVPDTIAAIKTGKVPQMSPSLALVKAGGDEEEDEGDDEGDGEGDEEVEETDAAETTSVNLGKLVMVPNGKGGERPYIAPEFTKELVSAIERAKPASEFVAQAVKSGWVSKQVIADVKKAASMPPSKRMALFREILSRIPGLDITSTGQAIIQNPGVQQWFTICFSTMETVDQNAEMPEYQAS